MCTFRDVLQQKGEKNFNTRGRKRELQCQGKRESNSQGEKERFGRREREKENDG